jgi:molecular chaperone DnaK (HSP70)
LQLKNNRKKKITLLGETVYPYILAQDFSGLQEHETLRILIDDIKIVQNEIDLAEKALKDISAKEPLPPFDREELNRQIQELEQQIESRIEDLKAVKKALDEDTKPKAH